MRMFLKLNSILVVIVILFSCCGQKNNDPVKVTASVNKNKITIGDKVNFILKIESNNDVTVSPIDLSPYFKAFEIKDHFQKGPTKSYGKTKIKYSLMLTTFTTGTYLIPEILVKYKTKNGEEKEIKSAKIYINVESVKPDRKDKDDIRDIKPPQTVKYPAFIYISLILILLTGVGLFVYFKYFKSKNINKVMENVEPTRPSHEVAYERFKKLKELELIKHSRIKEYYIILSEIVRSYLEARFKLPIVERTTLEAYKEMRESGKIKKKEISIIKDFLDECDLVKFAKYVPEEKSINNDYETAVDIVDRTKDILASDNIGNQVKT